MATKKDEPWSNSVSEDIDEEMRRQTPREKQISALIAANKDAKPKRYDIKSKNKLALRVVHDHDGNIVSIPPLGEKLGVLLLPNIAEYLSKGDLTVTEVAR